jgi:hypothetical protein
LYGSDHERAASRTGLHHQRAVADLQHRRHLHQASRDHLHCTDPVVYTEPNNYIKLYDYVKIYFEFYITNYIAKVYINMVSVNIFVNNKPAATDNQKFAAAADPLLPPRAMTQKPAAALR